MLGSKLTRNELGTHQLSSTGIVLLLFGGYLADRISRRHILLLGVGGLDLLLILLTFVSSYVMLLLTLLFGGMCASCYDLVVNSIGGDYERPYASDAMTLFHAGYSGDAALMAVGGEVALTQGIGFRSVYVATGVLFLLLAGAVLRLRLPSSARTRKAVRTEATSNSLSSLSVIALLLTQVVLLAMVLIGLCLLTDGALEGYTSIYLRNVLRSGVLPGGHRDCGLSSDRDAWATEQYCCSPSLFGPSRYYCCEHALLRWHAPRAFHE